MNAVFAIMSNSDCICIMSVSIMQQLEFEPFVCVYQHIYLMDFSIDAFSL